jgi:SPP1 gp7 family putative phage head morphogenesis protein
VIRFTKARKHKPTAAPTKKAEGDNKATLDRLKSYLDTEEPRNVKLLVSFWGDQSALVTYKELREAFIAGEISIAQFNEWQREYAEFVNDKLVPQWRQAMDAAASEVREQYTYFLYNPAMEAAQDYITRRGSELVTRLAMEQRDALNAMIAQSAYFEGTTADELARLMRPVIGLTKPQTLANLRYYEAVKLEMLKANPKMALENAEKRAREAAVKYAARQHRYRAQNIARTELADAYNHGHYYATKDAQSQGYIGDCKKVWLTADDERVCPVCGAIDGEERRMEYPFSIGVIVPPAHPSCRCAVAFEEIDPNEILPDKTDTGAFEWVSGLSREDKEKFLGGKMKAQMFDDGNLSKEDYFKPLKDINPETRMRYNLEPPSDGFISKLAAQQNLDKGANFVYTEGKFGAARYYYDNGQPIWPQNNGAVGLTRTVTLKQGSLILDRFGNINGEYFGVRKEPLEMRSLPQAQINPPYNEYRIISDVANAEAGTIAPWFGEPGGGTQYKIPMSGKRYNKALQRITTGSKKTIAKTFSQIIKGYKTMTLQGVKEWLRDNNIPDDSCTWYSDGGGASYVGYGYIHPRTDGKWITYWVDGHTVKDMVVHETEDAACRAFIRYVSECTE